MFSAFQNGGASFNHSRVLTSFSVPFPERSCLAYCYGMVEGLAWLQPTAAMDAHPKSFYTHADSVTSCSTAVCESFMWCAGAKARLLEG